MVRQLRRGLIGLLVAFAGVTARADEGMWLMNAPPLELLKQRYGFEPTSAWLEHVQKSAVRINDGGSGSFVSANGLIMTNHHVASGQLDKLSTPERNLMTSSFLAKTNAEELRCPDVEIDMLTSIEDVTSSVKDAMRDLAPAEAFAARRSRIAEIEKQAHDRSGLHAEVVTLYGGGLYHLYLYKRFTDVRLVFAPELQAAYFGGDVDNFEFPRFNLDVTFLRAYEDGKPYKPTHYLKFAPSGASEGDLVFVAGHPGRTNRQFSMDHLRFLRDIEYPIRLGSAWRREVQLSTFIERNAENKRMALDDLLGVQNGRKAMTARYMGLLDPKIIAGKASDERALRDAIDAKPEWRAAWGSAWGEIAKSRANYATFYTRHRLLETGGMGGSSLFRMARSFLRLAEEKTKPSGERLSEYRDTNLDSLKRDLFSPAPIYDTLEVERITSGLQQLAEQLGGDDPIVITALGGLSPRARAETAVRDTALKDEAFRKKLWEGGSAAVAGFGKDPMLALAIALDKEARELRKRYETEVDAVERPAYAKIAAARFEIQGTSTYPDATFTLRLSIGTIKSYEEDGKTIPAFTTMGGLFQRGEERAGQEAFDVPASWTSHKDKLDLSTPFNFVSTNDIIGGNSGSPVISKNGEAVGLIFDSNRHALVGDVVYQEGPGRSVSVDVRAILAALRDIYGAGIVADELLGK